MLKKVLEELLNIGYSKELAINSDGPTLPLENISTAIELLEEFDLVLGPGIDGGYYLIGTTGLHSTLFENIDWSTPRVIKQTMARAKAANLKPALLPYGYDVDTVENLHRLEREIDRISTDRLIYTRQSLFESRNIQENQ